MGGKQSKQSSEQRSETETNIDYRTTETKDSDSVTGCCIQVRKVVARSRFDCCKSQSTVDVTITG